jgi:hypothetical protein
MTVSSLVFMFNLLLSFLSGFKNKILFSNYFLNLPGYLHTLSTTNFIPTTSYG